MTEILLIWVCHKLYVTNTMCINHHVLVVWRQERVCSRDNESSTLLPQVKSLFISIFSFVWFWWRFEPCGIFEYDDAFQKSDYLKPFHRKHIESVSFGRWNFQLNNLRSNTKGDYFWQSRLFCLCSQNVFWQFSDILRF